MKRYILFALLIYSSTVIFGCRKEAEENGDTVPRPYGITARLEIASADSNGIIVNAIFQNDRSEPIQVEKWFVLSGGGMQWQAFRVMRNKAEVPYTWRITTMLEPSAEDYLMLQPAMPFVSKIRLENFYDLSLPGTYTITYEGYWMLPDENGEENLFCVQSNTADFQLKKGVLPTWSPMRQWQLTKKEIMYIAMAYINDHWPESVESVNNLEPIITTKDGSVEVTFRMPEYTAGGVPVIEINSQTRKVVKAFHTQ
jgi:hypothetical protein